MPIEKTTAATARFDGIARLAPGDPVEVAWDISDGLRVAHGRFERVGRDPFGDSAVFWCSAGESHDVPLSALRRIRPVDPVTLTGSYQAGERVTVRSRGRDYVGTVVQVTRLRLTVRIVLGYNTCRERPRDLTVSPLDVRRPDLPRPH